MKKILLAFDGTRFSEGAFEFARKLNELKTILLIGVFLPQAELANLWSYVDGVGVTFIPKLEKDDSEQVQKILTTLKNFAKSMALTIGCIKIFLIWPCPN